MMTHMKNLLTILLILLPLSAYAWGVVVSSGGVAAAGGEPASGTVLFGTCTAGSGDCVISAAGQEIYFDGAYTASWAESASTTTVGTVEIYLEGLKACNVKAIITDSSGNILTNGVSAATAISDDFENNKRTFTFSPAPTVTKNSTYKIAFVSDTDNAVLFSFTDTGTDGIYHESGGSYATPANLGGADGNFDTSATAGGMCAKK